jgi:hypothetical protein
MEDELTPLRAARRSSGGADDAAQPEGRRQSRRGGVIAPPLEPAAPAAGAAAGSRAAAAEGGSTRKLSGAQPATLGESPGAGRKASGVASGSPSPPSPESLERRASRRGGVISPPLYADDSGAALDPSPLQSPDGEGVDKSFEKGEKGLLTRKTSRRGGVMAAPLYGDAESSPSSSAKVAPAAYVAGGAGIGSSSAAGAGGSAGAPGAYPGSSRGRSSLPSVPEMVIATRGSAPDGAAADGGGTGVAAAAPAPAPAPAPAAAGSSGSGGGGAPSGFKTERQRAVELAAFYLKAAVFDRRIDHKSDPESMRLLRIYYESRVLNFLVQLAVFGLMVVTVFEGGRDVSERGSESWWVYGAEAACWLVLAGMYLLRVMTTQPGRLFESVFARVHAVSLLIALADLVCSVIAQARGSPYYRYARVVRPLLQLEYNQTVRRRFVDILRTLYHVRAAFLLLVFHITFFSIVSMFIFYGTPEGDAFFATLADSWVTLVILLSTCNSPRVMLPAFNDNKLYSLYFVAYLLVSIWFLMNLVLSVVYNEHRRHLKREARRIAVRKRVCTSAAFRVLLAHTAATRVAGGGAAAAQAAAAAAAAQAAQAAANSEPEVVSGHDRYDFQGPPKGLVVDLLIALGLRRHQSIMYVQLLDSLAEGPRGFVSRNDFENVLLILHMAFRSSDLVDPDELEEGDAALGRGAGAAESESEGEEQEEEEEDNGGDEVWNVNAAMLPRLRVESVQEESYHEERMFDWQADGEDSCPRCWVGCAKTRRSHSKGFKRFAVKTVTHHIWLGQHLGYIKTLDCAVNSVLAGSLVLTAFLLAADPASVLLSDPTWYAIFNGLCTAFFVFEIAMRIKAAGAGAFFEYSWNIFEFLIVAGGCLGLLGQLASWGVLSSYQKVFLFLRKLRLLRLLRSVPHFRLLTEVVTYLIPALATFGRVILCFMYVYAILAMGYLGDVRLGDDYAANDFSTFPLALLTLFELMVVNDWNSTMASFYRQTGSGWTRVFFIVWYFFAVVVLLNSVTSFSLEALDHHITQARKLDEHERLTEKHRELKNSQQAAAILGNSSLPAAQLSLRVRLVSSEVQRSFEQRMTTAERVKNISRRSLGRSGIVQLLNDVFDDEVAEPSTLEIDQELERLGLRGLTDAIG